MHELRGHRFFDVFEYNGPRQHWGCFLCNHPDRARDFIQVEKAFFRVYIWDSGFSPLARFCILECLFSP